MTTSAGRVTVADCVNAASDIHAEIEAGTLDPARIERRAVDACRSLFGLVGNGPDDPLWSLHLDITRQFLGAGGLSAAELAEWLAVQRRREGAAEGEAASGAVPAVPADN